MMLMTTTAFTRLDVAIFVGIFLLVPAYSLWKSRGEKSSSDYFLGRRFVTRGS
jgi:Na+/proline symporter